jgi:general secretion pathway protein F/type IV pilus assembly protein PilC
MLQRNPPAPSFRQPITTLLAQISQGATVADAMRSLGAWMPEFDVALIQAGEHSGRLDAVCKLLAHFYEDRARMLSQMLTDLAYPLFVLHFAIFLFPMISMFNGGTMFGYALKTFGVLALLYAATFLGIYLSQSRRGAAWRSSLENILRPVPMLGTARQSLALARLTAALEALTNAGVNIIEAWQMAAAASGSPAMQRTVATWKPLLAGGQTPADLVKSSPLFPELFGNLYYTGEISGQLDDSLHRLQTYYQEDGSRKSHLLAQIFARLVYFSIVGFVAYKVIHVALSYFNELDKVMK